MLVDPETGLPLENGGYTPGSIGGALAMDAASAYGVAEPWVLDTLEDMPSILATGGWNAFRGSRTIRKGPARGSFLPRPTGSPRGWWDGNNWHRKPMAPGGAIANHLNPRTWGRFSHSTALSSTGGKGATYSPFNVMSRTANWAVNRHFQNTAFTRGISIRAGQAGIINSSFQVGSHAPGWFGAGNGELNRGNFVSPGMFSRISASTTMARSSGGQKWNHWFRTAGRSRAQMANAFNFFNATDPAFGRAASSMRAFGVGSTANEVADMILMSSQGTVNQYIGGYLSGVTREFSAGSTLVAQASNRTSWITGRALGARHLGLGGFMPGEKIGMGGFVRGLRTAANATNFATGGRLGLSGAAKFGGAAAAKAAGLALPGVNIAMTAWMAYDLLKMGGSLAKSIGRLGKDAAISARGSLFKPAFGMGFQDNTVAATSRARGVMAIQNSRLNARSVIGSEAGMMAAHFG